MSIDHDARGTDRQREEDQAWEEHFARREAEAAAESREIDALRVGMTPGQAREIVARDDQDDNDGPGPDAYGADHEYLAAKRVLREERDTDTTRSDTMTDRTQQERADTAHNVLSNDPVDSGPRTPDRATAGRPTRYEVVARARNEIDGREEPATITVDEHQARLAGRIDFPDDGRARSHDDVQEERRQLLARVEREIVEERAQRADPDTARHVEARDNDIAAGRFKAADAAQRLIEGIRNGSVGRRRSDDPARAQGRTRGRTEVRIADRDYRGGPDRLERVQITRGREQR